MDKLEPPKRLCSEIQLFDLCSRDDCEYKKERYCTKADILARFEAISDDEDACSSDQYLPDEMEEMEEDGLDYDEGVGVGEDEEEPEEEGN
jgi:hypothetical protein